MSFSGRGDTTFSGPFGYGLGGDIFHVSDIPGMDPLNAFPNNQPGGKNWQALNQPIPTKIPTLGGGMTGGIVPGVNTPRLYDPNSFAARPLSSEPFNAMAQRAAGSMYVPTLLQPQQAQQPQSQPGVKGALQALQGMSGNNSPMMRHPGGRLGYPQ